MSTLHIKLIGRDCDAEVYLMSVPDAVSGWRVYISSACIAAGGKWQELRAQAERYRKCLSA